MSESIRIRRNTLFSLLSISSRLIANVILFWILARYYGPTIFGQFTFAHTLSFIFIIIADFGFDVLLTNEIARDRNRAVQIFQQFFSLKLLFTLLSLSGMWLFAFLAKLTSESRIMILIFSVYMLFTTLTNFLHALYRGFERLEYETKVSLFVNVSLLILTVVLIIIKAHIILIAGAFVFTRVLGFVKGIRYSFRLLKNISFKLTFSGFNRVRNKVFVYGFHLVFNYLLFQLDTVLLALWKGNYEVGIYQSVIKLVLIPLVIPDILTNTLTPTLVRFNSENQIKWIKLGNVMNKFLFITALPISIIFLIYPEQIINLIYGHNNYLEAIPILQMFSIVLFTRFNFEALSLMLTTADKQHIRMKVVIIATIINFILNYFLIPWKGAYGASISALITNLFVFITYFFVNSPHLFNWIFNLKTINVFIISLAFISLLWHFGSFTVLIMAPTILFIFIIIGYFYFFSKDEKKLIIPEDFYVSLNKWKII